MSKFSDILSVLLFVMVPAMIITIAGKSVYHWWVRRRKIEAEQPQTVSVAERLTQRTESEVPQTIEEQTITELRAARSLYEAGRVLEFVDAISLLIRRYVGDRYDVKVADVTTSQMLANLPQSLSDGVVDHVGEILHTCDALKFARHRPARSELDRLYQSAIEFVQNHLEPEGLPEEAMITDADSEGDETEDELHEIFQRYFPR